MFDAETSIVLVEIIRLIGAAIAGAVSLQIYRADRQRKERKRLSRPPISNRECLDDTIKSVHIAFEYLETARKLSLHLGDAKRIDEIENSQTSLTKIIGNLADLKPPLN